MKYTFNRLAFFCIRIFTAQIFLTRRCWNVILVVGATPPLPSVPDDSSSGKFVAQSAVATQLAAHSVSPLAPGVVDSTSTIRDGDEFLGEDDAAFESRGLEIVTQKLPAGFPISSKGQCLLVYPSWRRGVSPGRGRRVAGGSQALRCDVLGCVSQIFIDSAWFCRYVSETCSFTNCQRSLDLHI